MFYFKENLEQEEEKVKSLEFEKTAREPAVLLAHPSFSVLGFSMYGLGSMISLDHKSVGHGYHPFVRGLFPPSVGFAVLHKRCVRLCLLSVWNCYFLGNQRTVLP